MKKSSILLGCGVLFFMSFAISCTEDTTSVTEQESVENVRAENESSVALTNAFLNSLKNETLTRSLSAIEYPKYFGGYYTDKETQRPIFKVVKGLVSEAKIDITKRISSSNFEIEECVYSYNELNDILKKLDEKFFSKDFQNNRISLGWNEYCIDVVNNVIKIRLKECSSNAVARFKSEVMDSPLFVFEQGGGIEYPVRVDEKNVDKNKNVTRSNYQIKMGGEIWVRGDKGSIGFRAKDEFDEGFVTAGHFAEFGAPVVLDSLYEEEIVGSFANISKNGVDAAFVTSLEGVSVLAQTAVKGYTLSPSIVVLGKNDKVCKEGAVTGYSEGFVLETGVRTSSGSYTFNNLTAVDYKSDNGDSGGVVYIPSSPYNIVGIHKSVSKSDPNRHFYVIANDVCSVLGVTAY